jgi:hypothetical protein
MGDELGCVRGGSGYPVTKRRQCSADGCKNLAAKRNRKCDRHRRTAGQQRERTTGRHAAMPGAVFQNVTRAEWIAIWRSQGGACVICRHSIRNRYSERHQPDARTAALDHCHVVEKDVGIRRSIRGLLCGFPCNRLLVRYWTADRLARAAKYVRDFPAQKVLKHGSTSDA